VKAPVYTIGHGTRAINDFIGILKLYAIDYLIDVRSRPYSAYNPHYIRENLKQSLEGNGITYVFMGDTLGGKPADASCYTNGRIDYEKVKQTIFFKEGILRLRTAYNKNLCIAIMCSESNPCHCHRSKLISEALAEQHIIVAHIDEKALIKTHEEVRKIIKPLENVLFK